jgi:hypothetical protein
MIMRNAVILVDQIETDVERPHAPRGDRGGDRAPGAPVVLTALAAILAMIPLSSSRLLGADGLTIMGGLFVATFLTLSSCRRSTPSGSAARCEERGGVPAPDGEDRRGRPRTHPVPGTPRPSHGGDVTALRIPGA